MHASALRSIKQEIMPIRNMFDIVNSSTVMIAWKFLSLSQLIDGYIPYIRQTELIFHAPIL